MSLRHCYPTLGYRDRSYDPPCPGHWTPEAPSSGTAYPGLPRASDNEEARDPEGSGAVQPEIAEEPDLEAEASEEAEPGQEPEMDPEPEPEPELEPEPDPEPEPEPEPEDYQEGDESEGVRGPKPSEDWWRAWLLKWGADSTPLTTVSFTSRFLKAGVLTCLSHLSPSQTDRTWHPAGATFDGIKAPSGLLKVNKLQGLRLDRGFFHDSGCFPRTEGGCMSLSSSNLGSPVPQKILLPSP